MVISHCKGLRSFFLTQGFRFNGPFRQYISLYRDISQREGGKKKLTDERKTCPKKKPKKKTKKKTDTRTDCKRSRPLSYYYLNQQDAPHWKLTQHHPQREAERTKIWQKRRKMSKPPPSTSTASTLSSCHILSKQVGRSGQHHRPTNHIRLNLNKSYIITLRNGITWLSLNKYFKPHNKIL